MGTVRARARSRRTLGTETGSRKRRNGENGAFFKPRGDMFHGRGRGNSTMTDLVSTEGKR